MQYISVDKNVAVIKVKGVWKAKGISRDLENEFNQVFSQGIRFVNVDFSETTYIDSTSMSLLLTISRKIGIDNLSFINIVDMEVKNALATYGLMRFYRER